MQSFHFLRPGWLFLIAPAIVIAGFLVHRQGLHSKAWKRVIRPHLLPALTIPASRMTTASIVLFPLLVALISVALSGPSWRRQPSPFSEQASLMVIALDISPSMTAGDVLPSRLERAKQKIVDILDRRPSGRIALVVFRATAHQVVPPTRDPYIIRHFLTALTPDILGGAGKSPESVLRIFQRLTARTEYPATLLLMTDGAGPDTEREFAEFFGRSSHELLLMGIGSATGTHSNSTTLPLDRPALERVAKRAGGHYISLTVDKKDIWEVVHRTDRHHRFGDDTAAPWIDDGYWLLIPVTLLFLLQFRQR